MSQIHQCDERIDSYFLSLLGAAVPIQKLVLVANWREAGAALAQREQATLTWAETLARQAAPLISDVVHQGIFAVLGHEQLVRLSHVIALENALSQTRLS